MADRPSQIQILFQKRNARKRGPTSSDNYNDSIDELAHDLAELSGQWNNRIVPFSSTVPDGSVDAAVDAFSNGLDGQNLYTDADSSASANPSYFNTAQSRPNTVFEQFQDVYTQVLDLEESLTNLINGSTPTAIQIPITDNGGFYAATNVENALAEIASDVAAISAGGVDFTQIASNVLPTTDNIYSLGSAAGPFRWKDLFLGPNSLQILARVADAGHTADKDFEIGIDGTTGRLTIKDGTTIVAEFDATGGASFPQGGAAALLDELTDVSAPSPTNGQVLAFNGSNWEAQTLSGSVTFPLTGPNGSLPGATFAFSANLDTGMSSNPSGDLILASKANAGLTINNTDGSTTYLQQPSGVPAIGADGAGINSPSTDTLELVTAGTGWWTIGNDGYMFNSTGSFGIGAPDGSAGGPAFAFDTAQDTGLYRDGSGEPAISMGGYQVARFSDTDGLMVDDIIDNGNGFIGLRSDIAPGTSSISVGTSINPFQDVFSDFGNFSQGMVLGDPTITPTEMLDIKGSVVIGNTLVGTSIASDSLLVEGIVSIGGYDPGAKLYMEGTNPVYLRMNNIGSSGYVGMQWEHDGNYGGFIGLNASADIVEIWDSNTEKRIEILPGGEVTMTRNLLLKGGQIYQDNLSLVGPSGTSYTVDWDNNSVQFIDLENATGNLTLTLNNGRIGASYVLIIRQDSTTPRDIIWPGTVLWQGGTVPVLSTGGDAVDVFTLLYDGANYYANVGQDYQ